MVQTSQGLWEACEKVQESIYDMRKDEERGVRGAVQRGCDCETRSLIVCCFR